MVTLAEILAAYDWYDHPEGPRFVETDRDLHRTSGHWLYADGAVSTFHRVMDSDELWFIHSGRLLLHVLEPDGRVRTTALGTDLAAGESPRGMVPQGLWQAAELPPGEPWAFGTCVCAPPFTFEDSFEHAGADALLERWPQHAGLIRRLTRARSIGDLDAALIDQP